MVLECRRDLFTANGQWSVIDIYIYPVAHIRSGCAPVAVSIRPLLGTDDCAVHIDDLAYEVIEPPCCMTGGP